MDKDKSSVNSDNGKELSLDDLKNVSGGIANLKEGPRTAVVEISDDTKSKI
jgi:bacteriocin-like protein